MGEYLLPTGQLLVNVHEPDKCRGEWCVIHNPLDTYDRERLHWRADKGLFEVICEHGVGTRRQKMLCGSRVSARMRSTAAVGRGAASNGSLVAKSGWCLTKHHEGCIYAPCTCNCHNKEDEA